MKHNDLRKAWRCADDLNRAREVEMAAGSRFGNSLDVRAKEWCTFLLAMSSVEYEIRIA